MGFTLKIKVFCGNCSWHHSLFTSDHCCKQGRGRHFCDINVRATIAFREIGKDATAITNFARIINMDGLAINSVNNINDKLYHAYDKVEEESMVNAALEIKESAELQDNKYMCRVSVDDSWQKRRHSSLNGLATLISNNKCRGKQTFSKFCKGCAIWENKQNDPQYHSWLTEHVCKIFYVSSDL